MCPVGVTGSTGAISACDISSESLLAVCACVLSRTVSAQYTRREEKQLTD